MTNALDTSVARSQSLPLLASPGVLSGAAPTAAVLVEGGPVRAAGCGSAGAARGAADGALLALPALVVAALLGRRRRRRG